MDAGVVHKNNRESGLIFVRLEKQAHDLGFDLVGVAPAQTPAEALQAYLGWLARGDYGEMAYMARADRVARRADPALILPGVRSLVCVAVHYDPGPPPPAEPLHGRVARYAWGQDYHDWMLPRLEELAAWIHAERGGKAHRAYVDTGPVLERAFAARAGLGFIGKNTCLIHPRFGSWLLLGVLLVDVDLPAGEPLPPRCGSCRRCLDACPTGALTAPYRLDARRCIAYLTIEHAGSIPAELRPLLGDRVFGCDECQAVCPWQRFSRPAALPAFAGQAALSLLELLAMDEEIFQRRFAGTPLLRTGRLRLQRNAAVALGNAGDPQAAPALARALHDPSPPLREHAAWALERIGSRNADERG